MSNLKLLKVLNPIMAIALLGVLIGLTLSRSALIPSLQGSQAAFQIHQISGIIFLICVLCHIALNWSWIKTQIFGIRPAKKAKKK